MMSRRLIESGGRWRRPALAAIYGGQLAAIALLLAGHWPLGLPLLAGAHALYLWGTLRPRSGLFGPVITRFETGAREVWLTIDDGPSEDTEAMLALLQAHEARATFFLIAERASAQPQRVRAIVAAGHGIGNHTAEHPAGQFWIAPQRRIRREIESAQSTLQTLGGRAPRLFRAVAGMANPSVAPVLARLGLRRIAWSARGFDTREPDPAVVTRRLLRGVFPGAILLLHEGARHGRSVDTLAAVLTALQARGYRCVIPDAGSAAPLGDEQPVVERCAAP